MVKSLTYPRPYNMMEKNGVYIREIEEGYWSHAVAVGL